MADYSEKFYEQNARRYAEVSHQFLQSVYVRSSHPALKNDWDLLQHLRLIIPGKCGLDAGCGAGARDVFYLWSSGYDIWGLDAVNENIRLVTEMHPEIANRVSVADIRCTLAYGDASFDFIICNAVIQHIRPEIVENTIFPEFARILKMNGILQLMFKNGDGLLTVYDKDFGVDRTFQLYNEHEVLSMLQQNGLELVIAASQEELGGIMRFTDSKIAEHCVFYVRKVR